MVAILVSTYLLLVPFICAAYSGVCLVVSLYYFGRTKPRPLRFFSATFGIYSSLLGLLAGLLFFFPHLTIDTQLYLLSGGLALGTLVAAWQAYKLSKVYRSGSSYLGALAFLSLGARQVWGFVRLRSAIAQARAKGVMIEHLSIEQWLVGVLWAYVIVIGFIVWQHWQHRDLKRLIGNG